MTNFFVKSCQEFHKVDNLQVTPPILNQNKQQWLRWLSACAHSAGQQHFRKSETQAPVFDVIPHWIRRKFTDSRNDSTTLQRFMGHPKMSVNGVQLIAYMQQLNFDEPTMVRILNLMLSLYADKDAKQQDLLRFTWAYTLTHQEIIQQSACVAVESIEAYHKTPEVKSKTKYLTQLEQSVIPKCELQALSAQEKEDLECIAHIAPSPKRIENLLRKLHTKLIDHTKSSNNPWELAAMAYHGIMRIQPFENQNEAIAITVMNQCLIDNDLQTINVFPHAKDQYQHALSLQIDNHHYVTKLLIEYYLQQHPTCHHQQTLLQSDPKNTQAILYKYAKRKNFAALINLLERIKPTERLAYLNQENIYGWTLLHYSCQANSEATIEYLLHCNANPSIKNNAGQKAFDLIQDPHIKARLQAIWQDNDWHECSKHRPQC